MGKEATKSQRVSKKDLFPLFFLGMGRVPTREELYWTRIHLSTMRAALAMSLNPYVYIMEQKESTKLRYIISDLNKEGQSLWPVRFTTNIRVVHARSVLRKLSSLLHLILKDYP